MALMQKFKKKKKKQSWHGHPNSSITPKQSPSQAMVPASQQHHPPLLRPLLPETRSPKQQAYTSLTSPAMLEASRFYGVQKPVSYFTNTKKSFCGFAVQNTSPPSTTCSLDVLLLLGTLGQDAKRTGGLQKDASNHSSRAARPVYSTED